MNTTHKDGPQLCVSESCRFCKDGVLDFGEWLDLIRAARSTNPETGVEARFEVFEHVIDRVLSEECAAAHARHIATESRNRGLMVGSVFAASQLGNALGTHDEQAHYERAIRAAAIVGRTLSDLHIRERTLICFTTGVSVKRWTTGHMTANSEELKGCLRNVVDFAATKGQHCALKLQCNRAASNSPNQLARFIVHLVNRTNLGVLIDTAELAYSLLGLNFASERWVPEDWKGDPGELLQVYRSAARFLSGYIRALHISQTTLATVSDDFGAVGGTQTVPGDPDGKLDLVRETGLILEHVPYGLRTLGPLTWTCSGLTLSQARTPETWCDALAALDRIRQTHGYSR